VKNKRKANFQHQSHKTALYLGEMINGNSGSVQKKGTGTAHAYHKVGLANYGIHGSIFIVELPVSPSPSSVLSF
tara:strand:+ start:26662 stop:26883 length:222 start_codon:yes stop_codon:yes gene_type:complete